MSGHLMIYGVSQCAHSREAIFIRVQHGKTAMWFLTKVYENISLRSEKVNSVLRDQVSISKCQNRNKKMTNAYSVLHVLTPLLTFSLKDGFGRAQANPLKRNERQRSTAVNISDVLIKHGKERLWTFIECFQHAIFTLAIYSSAIKHWKS